MGWGVTHCVFAAVVVVVAVAVAADRLGTRLQAMRLASTERHAVVMRACANEVVVCEAGIVSTLQVRNPWTAPRCKSFAVPSPWWLSMATAGEVSFVAVSYSDGVQFLR